MSYSTIDSLSDTDIVHLCSPLNPDRIILGSILGGASVVKILDVAVKFGFGVKENEWRNHAKAYELINSTVVRVPKPYRFFTSGANGYLVMEYIKGEVLDCTTPMHVSRLRNAIFHLATIQSDRPGSLGDGPSRGPLWSPYHDFTPTNSYDIEHYYNRRLRRIGRQLNIKGLPFVLVHGDIVDRNIIVTDEYIALVDWASAGFYPKLFERCAMRMNSNLSDSTWDAVDKSLGNLNEEEEAQVALLRYACSQYDRFICGVGRFKPVIQRRLPQDTLQAK